MRMVHLCLKSPHILIGRTGTVGARARSNRSKQPHGTRHLDARSAPCRVRFPKSPIGDAPATTRAARNHPRGTVTSLLSSLSIGYLGITLAREGGTTYTFVTEGIESALAQAQAVAGTGMSSSATESDCSTRWARSAPNSNP